MNRREFFKSLALGAAVIAIPGAALKVLAQNPGNPAATAAIKTQAPLTLRALQKAFFECSVGKECPSQIFLSSSCWIKFEEMMRNHDERQLFVNPKRPIQNLTFHGADVCPDPDTPDDMMVFINEEHPDNPSLNKRFRLDEI